MAEGLEISVKIVINYLKPHFPKMTIGFMIKFVGTIMDLLLPWILAYIIDEIVPQNNVKVVMLWGMMMVLCAIISVVANVLANRMASAVARDTTRVIRNDLFQRIQSLSASQVDEMTESSLISRMTSDTYNIHHIVGMSQRLGVRAPILLIGGIIMTLTLDPVLALILIASLPFLGITVFFVAKKGIPMYEVHQSSADVLIRKVRESVTGIRVIKALSKVNYEKTQFEEINQDVVNKETKAASTMALTNPVMNLVLNMGWVFIILVGAIRVNKGLTEVGTIIAFLTYFTIILNAMLSMTRLFVLFSKAGASAARIQQVLDCKEALVVEKPDSNEKNDYCHEIEFENVSFSYNKQKMNLNDINFKVKKGDTIGIIGATGSGKTTIINLLLREYDVDRGAIKIKGKNIKQYKKDELHGLFGVAFQNDNIFEDTVKNNVTLGRQTTFEEVKNATKWAQISGHIESMPEKYDSYVAIKGANLSGGQKQRLLIARALLNHPSILVLDDASSALDYKTDAALRKCINENFKDATKIIVAQRVSSVMNADQILVLDDGNVVGLGTHDELMNCCKEYSEISKLQMSDI